MYIVKVKFLIWGSQFFEFSMKNEHNIPLKCDSTVYEGTIIVIMIN